MATWLAGKLQSSLARCRADGRVDGNKSGIAYGGLRPLKMTRIIETWLFGLFGTLLCDFAIVRRRIAKSYVRIRPLTHSCRRGCAVGRSYYVVIRSQSAGERARAATALWLYVGLWEEGEEATEWKGGT